MVERFAHWVTKHPWWVICLLLPILGGFIAGAQRLVLSADYRIFFSEDNPHLQAFEDLQDTYTKNDNVLFIIAPKNGEVFTLETLGLVKQLTRDAQLTPLSIRVDSITNYQHTYAVYDEEEDIDDLVVGDLVGKVAKLTADKIEKIKNIALNEPLLVKRLISPSGHVTAVNVTISMPSPPEETAENTQEYNALYGEFTKQTRDQVEQVAEYSRQLVRDIKKNHPSVDVYLSGVSMMNQAFPEVAQKDSKTLIPIMFLCVLIMVGLMLRSVFSVVATLVLILLSIASAMGLAGWFDFLLSPPVLSAPTMILTLAVADCVHLLATFLLMMRQGRERQMAMVQAIQMNFQPIMLTSLTTAIGFLSMNFSDAPPFRVMGNVVALGVVIAFILALTLLPALMMVLPVQEPKTVAEPSPWVDRFADWVIRWQTKLLLGGAIVVVTLIAFISKNELNDEFVKYFSTNIPFRVASEFSSDNLAGLYTIHYSLSSGEEQGVNDPVFLENVEKFSQWLRLQPEVEHVNSITDIVKRLNKNMHEDRQEFYRIPDDDKEIAEYFFLYEMSLRKGQELTNQIDLSKSATRLGVTLQNLSTTEMLNLEARVQAWMRDNLPEVMWVEGTGSTIMFSHIGERNIKTMLVGTAVALVLISGILIFALRSFSIGVLSLVPNLVPPLVGFGIWGIFSGSVGLGLSVVAGMTLGIVVDDTVHFLSKYLRAKRENNMTSEDAVRYAFHHVGHALVITTSVLMVGFSVLATSDFTINSDMGLLSAIVIGVALLADFLILPPLLLKTER